MNDIAISPEEVVATENEIVTLAAENASLKAFIADLQHDFAATLAHCDAHHVEGEQS